LANTTVDDLVEFLDLSLDEAEVILSAAQAVIAMRDRTLNPEGDETASEEGMETHAVSSEFDESIDADDVEPSDEMTAAGYDEAVEKGTPLSGDSDLVDTAVMTEVEVAPEELLLQEASRDLRPDTITPDPDLGATEISGLENIDNIAAEMLATDEEIASEEQSDEATNQTPAVTEDAASSGSSNEEKQ